MSNKLFSLVLAMVLTIAFGSTVYAHRMIVTRDNDVLLVRYDDGTAARRATVRLLDEGDRVLWEGNVSENGTLSLPVKNFAKAVADDGLGHRATYRPGQVGRELPRPLAATLGVSFFLFIASVGRYMTQKQQKSNEQG